jgi:Glycosyl hydrolase family 12
MHALCAWPASCLVLSALVACAGRDSSGSGSRASTAGAAGDQGGSGATQAAGGSPGSFGGSGAAAGAGGGLTDAGMDARVAASDAGTAHAGSAPDAGTGSHDASAGSGGDAGAAGKGADSGCTSPAFVTSDPNGGWSDGGYYVHNNMWNSAAGLGPETLYACSFHDWYVVSNQANSAGAVKTYPNVHKDYADVPIASFSAITSRFAAASPHVGIYDVAYDIWTNGVASSGSTEIMIWTENYKQVPSGSRVTTVSFDGRSYDVWKTPDGHYIAFVPTQVITSGSLDILAFFTWTMSQGWLQPDSTLGQIDFGVEIVSTDGADARFEFTDFSISD